MLFSCSWVNTELKYLYGLVCWPWMSLSVVKIYPVGVLRGPTLLLIILLSLT